MIQVINTQKINIQKFELFTIDRFYKFFLKFIYGKFSENSFYINFDSFSRNSRQILMKMR